MKPACFESAQHSKAPYSESKSEAFPSLFWTGKYKSLLGSNPRYLVVVLQTTGIFGFLCMEEMNYV